MVIEDEFGLVNVVVKPDVYEAHRTLVRSEPFVIIRGELQRRDGVINLIAQSFVPLTAGGLSPAAHNFGTGHGGSHHEPWCRSSSFGTAGRPRFRAGRSLCHPDGRR